MPRDARKANQNRGPSQSPVGAGDDVFVGGAGAGGGSPGAAVFAVLPPLRRPPVAGIPAAAADAAAVGAIKATAVGGEVAVVDVDVDVDVDADADADEFPRPTIPSATAALCRFP